MSKYEKYNHHKREVFVRTDLKGKHREYCLCHSCEKLDMVNRDKNCPIAKILFDTCVKFDLVTPVFECPNFSEKVK